MTDIAFERDDLIAELLLLAKQMHTEAGKPDVPLAKQKRLEHRERVLRAAVHQLTTDRLAAEALALRRKQDSKRQKRRRKRHVTSRDNPGGHVTNVTPLSPLVLSSIPQEEHTHTPRARGDDEESGKGNGGAATVIMTQLKERMGAEWSDVRAFLRRRPVAGRGAWAKEMLSGLQRWTPADMARVSRDDELAPITTPLALRSFLAAAQRERLDGPNGGGSRARRAAERRAPQTYEYTPTKSAKDVKWQD